MVSKGKGFACFVIVFFCSTKSVKQYNSFLLSLSKKIFNAENFVFVLNISSLNFRCLPCHDIIAVIVKDIRGGNSSVNDFLENPLPVYYLSCSFNATMMPSGPRM